MIISATLLLSCACGPATTAASTQVPRSRQNCSPAAAVEGISLTTAGTLTIGSDLSYPPQEFYAPQSHEATGFDIDLGRELAGKLCLSFAVWNESFSTIIDDLQKTDSRYDVILSAMTITPDRSKELAFIPYLKAGQQLIVRKDARYAPQSLAQLCGMRVAVESGTAEQDELTGAVATGCADNPLKVMAYSTDAEALEQLKKGAADVQFTDSPVAQYDVSQDGALKVSSPVFQVAPEGIGLRLTDVKLDAALSKALAALQEDGTYAALLERWGLQNSSI